VSEKPSLTGEGWTEDAVTKICYL